MTLHHTHTPTLTAFDPRAKVLRRVGYCRERDDERAEARVIRSLFDARGDCIARWDPRLWQAHEQATQQARHGLGGQRLLEQSQDAGWTLHLDGPAGQPAIRWDARGTRFELHYDECLRLVSVTEHPLAQAPRVVERLTWGRPDGGHLPGNSFGRLRRHDDRAGSERFAGYSLRGRAQQVERRFLARLDTPDWPLEPQDREGLLEARSFVTRFHYSPLDDLLMQDDAAGGQRRFFHSLLGQLREARLQLPGQASQVLVHAMGYDAQGQLQAQTLGNGVQISAEHAPSDGRLMRLHAAVPGQAALQDLHYTYDPRGNVLTIADASQSPSFFRNQRVDPVSRYRYDSLGQLVEAKGREAARLRRGPLPGGASPTALDPGKWVNYTRHYHYDAAGNLLRRAQGDDEAFACAVSRTSNRSLAQRDDGSLPDEASIAAAFDANGNLLALSPGQALAWDTCNQLSRVTLLRRDQAGDDEERYHYDHDGRRVRKTTRTEGGSRVLIRETRYLPGLELHREQQDDTGLAFDLAVGRSRIRVLSWPGIPVMWRYSLLDHLGSCAIELDEHAGILSHEGFYPFGGTSWWTAYGDLETTHKRYRYCARERDASGLYYFGRRYYASWLQRWISPDPLGDVDGLNRYLMVRNNPMAWTDSGGLIATPVHKADLEVAEEMDDLSRSNEVRHLRLPQGDIVLKDFSADFAMDQDTIDIQRLRASNEVFAYALSETTRLVRVPPTQRVVGHDREVVSGFIAPGAAPARIGPEQHLRLKVFDFLLDSRDREETNGQPTNVLFDEEGSLYAIDHEHSLGLGAASSRPRPPATLELDEGEKDLLGSLPEVVEGLQQTEWATFYDRQTDYLEMAERPELIASRAGFLARIERVLGYLR
ncbi:RHS repeat domain-containing protein [Pseudomonas wadenswilerensis]